MPPLYDYTCGNCNKTKEVLESHSENIRRICVDCNQVMIKLASPANFSFKGSGFYKNDYPKGK